MNEIEQKAVRKDGDVTMCDLLNKEIEELTNQKEIEEMADIIVNSRYKNDYISPLKGATELHNAGYKNCKDKVVLSKEEWARLRNLEINYDDTYEHYREYSNENKKLKAENERLIIELKARANINADDFDEMQTLRRATFELKAENERLTDKLGKILLTVKMDDFHKAEEIDKARKETAREILQELKTKAIENGNKNPIMGARVSERDLCEFAKEYGVEVERWVDMMIIISKVLEKI